MVDRSTLLCDKKQERKLKAIIKEAKKLGSKSFISILGYLCKDEEQRKIRLLAKWARVHEGDIMFEVNRRKQLTKKVAQSTV